MFFVSGTQQFPEKFAEGISNLLWEMNRPHAREIHQMAEKLSKLWPSLALKRGQAKAFNEHYSKEHAMTEAYLAYYLPANAMKLKFILEEISHVYPDLLPKNVKISDLGCGPGTMGLSAYQFSQDRSQKIQSVQYVGIDQSKNMISLAEKMFSSCRIAQSAAFKFAFSVQNVFSTSVFEKTLENYKPNIVCFSNSLGEFSGDTNDREKFFSQITETFQNYVMRSQAPCFLIVIEPGAQTSSRELLKIRENIRNHEHVQILLPCLSQRPCGAYENPKDWCHEEISMQFPKWHDELGHEAGLRKESMIFSYLVFGFGLQKNHQLDFSRVVSQHIREKGLSKCYFCTPNGKQMVRLLHSKTTEENKKFDLLKRGDLIESFEVDEKSSIVSMKVFNET